MVNRSTIWLVCVADETKPRYSPSANQRPKACSAQSVLPRFSMIGSNWLLHMAVLSCTEIGRVDLVTPWLPDTQNKHGDENGTVLLKFCSELPTQWYVYFFAALSVRLAFTAPQDLHFRHLSCMHVLA